MADTTTDQIIADAAVAQEKDEGLVTAAVMLDPLLDIPRWLRRNLSEGERAEAWIQYRNEHGLEGAVHIEAMRAPRAPVPLTRVFSVEEKRDLRAEAENEKTRIRITKMKAGQERKKLSESGALKTMPLSGKAALDKIKEGD